VVSSYYFPIMSIVDVQKLMFPYRGNFSASRSTVSIPSLAKAAAAYDPAGPPPITRTVHRLGMETMMRCDLQNIWLAQRY
jgi:hypothetical protein